MTLFQADSLIVTPGREEAIEFLMRDRPWSAYALGYLDPASGVTTKLSALESGGRIESVLLQASLPQLMSIYASGDPDGIGSILEGSQGMPASGVFSIRGEALYEFEHQLNVSTAYQMHRMVIRRGELRPRPMAGLARLGIDDLEPVKRLSGMWTDSHQLPSQLSGGIYYGVYKRAELVAIAGTHCVSREFRIGAIGNVLTHGSHRNRGLASATTTAVAEELFRLGCEEVVLNVRQGNEIAHHTYEQLGFHDHCNFIEGVFHSRIGRR
jgi:ribosomal protein S18 acetylase RimI-like enzyme